MGIIMALKQPEKERTTITPENKGPSIEMQLKAEKERTKYLAEMFGKQESIIKNQNSLLEIKTEAFEELLDIVDKEKLMLELSQVRDIKNQASRMMNFVRTQLNERQKEDEHSMADTTIRLLNELKTLREKQPAERPELQ
jgi:hypothetical protein